MSAHKFSITLPDNQCNFIEKYKEEHHYKNTSKVFQDAIELLQESYLEECYKEANDEMDDAWDVTLIDGLEDESW